MAKKVAVRSFEQVLSALGTERFDVSPAAGNRHAAARRVSKYGCAAEIVPASAPEAHVRVEQKGGWVLGGEISRLTDRGYQKFLKTTKLEIPATADILRSIHRFNEELTEACGGLELYNEAMGTTSDRYVYDRVKGRA